MQPRDEGIPIPLTAVGIYFIAHQKLVVLRCYYYDQY